MILTEKRVAPKKIGSLQKTASETLSLVLQWKIKDE